MFEYKKDMNDVVYEIKTDGSMYLYLKQRIHREVFILGEWSLMISSHLGNEKYANSMIQLSADWFTIAERLGIAIRKLQGNTAYFIDVIDRESFDVEEVKESSGQMMIKEAEKIEHYPDDFCGTLIACRKKCELIMEVFVEAIKHSEDEQMKLFLNDLVDRVAKYKLRYQNILDNFNADGQREFCDNYEDDRAWALDNGNYFDPKIPEFYNDK